MSILQYDGYLNQLKSSQESYKTETLQIQRKFLYSLCSHHRLWANQTDDAEIASFHTKAAELALVPAYVKQLRLGTMSLPI